MITSGFALLVGCPVMVPLYVPADRAFDVMPTKKELALPGGSGAAGRSDYQPVTSGRRTHSGSDRVSHCLAGAADGHCLWRRRSCQAAG